MFQRPSAAIAASQLDAEELAAAAWTIGKIPRLGGRGWLEQLFRTETRPLNEFLRRFEDGLAGPLFGARRFGSGHRTDWEHWKAQIEQRSAGELFEARGRTQNVGHGQRVKWLQEVP